MVICDTVLGVANNFIYSISEMAKKKKISSGKLIRSNCIQCFPLLKPFSDSGLLLPQ